MVLILLNFPIVALIKKFVSKTSPYAIFDSILSGAPLSKSLLYKHKEMPFLGFPGGSDGTESACNTGDLGSIPGLGRHPGEGNGDPL